MTLRLCFVSFEYTLNHHREISRKEKQEAAVRLRNSGKSYRQIGEMIGVGKTTVERWVAEHNATVPNGTPAVTADTADGKTYPAEQSPQHALDDRALRIRAHVESGLTHEQAAQIEGVSLRTVYNDLARVDEILADMPDLGEAPTFLECRRWM
ncbi:helix-turn-helix domain-containing protein [Paenibacillus algicola]|uniref:helix-turn-helix domain-containing protein n=1 Tax=Paenibacillus algicola TaxID=2565926 RepID=UPI0010FD6006|nr:helix-turn-helix domain-containing protein [Paenibacillus algicola]